MQNWIGMYEYSKGRQAEFLKEAAKVRMLEQAKENGRLYRSVAADAVAPNVRHVPSVRPQFSRFFATLYCRLASLLF